MRSSSINVSLIREDNGLNQSSFVPQDDYPNTLLYPYEDQRDLVSTFARWSN
ncbi:hypothetical protein BH23CHL1_BH23CHL1_10250 [soil metagenome]